MSNPHPEPDARIAGHYARSAGLVPRLQAALKEAGHNLDQLPPDALAGAEEFHLGGLPATAALLEAFAGDDTRNWKVLDVGCGIGGPARTIARSLGCHVTGVDLTPESVEAATAISQWLGVSDHTTFRVGSALALPFDDGSFDAVVLIHVGMNIADKRTLLAELARATRPGGRVVVYDIMRAPGSSGDELVFPLPWASEAASSSLAPLSDYEEAASAAGLAIEAVVDRTDLVRDVLARVKASPPKIHLGHLMGAEWPTMFGNLLAGLEAGHVAPVQITSRRP